jgi:hypothetical protein
MIQDQKIRMKINQRPILKVKPPIRTGILIYTLAAASFGILGELLAQSVKPTDPVKVQGVSEATGTIRALSVTDLRTQRSMVEIPTGPGTPPPIPNAESRQPLSAKGQIKILTYAPLGEIDGAVLTDGTIIHFPPAAERQYANILRVHETLAVTGFGTANQFGRSLEAVSLGSSVDQMSPVDVQNRPLRQPGPVGPAQQPPAQP